MRNSCWPNCTERLCSVATVKACVVFNAYSHTYAVCIYTAVSGDLDCFVLISAAHWCKEEFIKTKKKVRKHQIGERWVLHSPVVIIAKSKREGWLVIKVIKWDRKKQLLIGPCHFGFSSLSIACSLCSQRREGQDLCGRRTGFLDSVSQPRNGADAHPAATVWDRRQVKLEQGLGQTLESSCWNFITLVCLTGKQRLLILYTECL